MVCELCDEELFFITKELKRIVEFESIPYTTAEKLTSAAFPVHFQRGVTVLSFLFISSVDSRLLSLPLPSIRARFLRDRCITCIDDFGSQGVDGDEFPAVFKSLVGRKMLFKVANPVCGSSADTGSIKVHGVCDDSNIISLFESPGSESHVSELPPEEAFPLSSTAPVVDLASDHAENFGDELGVTPSSLVSPNSICSASNGSFTPPSSVGLQTPPTALKKKFDNLFADDTPLTHVPRKRVTKSVKK
ncbi:hypothetical protein RIF29_34379 [Crotalaria pallida]|uniref:Uncharacterized protein n=1 Tax=Crotalaria pallida TaxID=3830 RepID=A0AAN9EEM4_CROPI